MHACFVSVYTDTNKDTVFFVRYVLPQLDSYTLSLYSYSYIISLSLPRRKDGQTDRQTDRQTDSEADRQGEGIALAS